MSDFTEKYMQLQAELGNSAQEPSNALVPMVITRDGPNERAMDITSRLLQQGIIILDGPVEGAMQTIFKQSMLYLINGITSGELKDTDGKTIKLYIHSPGGSVLDGLSMYEVICLAKSKGVSVQTVTTGMAASMGTFLATVGTKGKRYIAPHATFMVHQLSGGQHGQLSHMNVSNEYSNYLWEKMVDIYQYHNNVYGQDRDTLKKVLINATAVLDKANTDNYLTAEEAVAHGFVDQVLNLPPAEGCA